jgi:hypothetical protein
VGWVTGRPGRVVSVPSAGIRGRGDAFETVLAPRGVRPPAPPGKARYRLSHGSPCVRPVPRPRVHR